MSLLILFLLLISGLLASFYYFKEAVFLLRLGTCIFFAITIVPFININLALFLGIYINEKVTLVTSFCSAGIFSALLYSRKCTFKGIAKALVPTFARNELPAIILLFLILVCLNLYYSNVEFLLSLGSYLRKGTATCFYMQTFRLDSLFNPGLTNVDAVVRVYDIICTPGNTLFTSTFIPILKLAGPRFLYLMFSALLYIFVYLISKRLLQNNRLSLFVALFALLNPYVLSVQALDRNFMALAVSAVFMYIVLEYKEKVFLQGLIFGILSGTGLRFLPIIFVVPAVLLFNNDRLKKALLFFLAFTITFTFNIPHLFFNGLNSLGENQSSLSLLYLAFTGWLRTPFLPLPNLIFYLVNIINYFGFIISGVICLGIVRLFVENKKLFFSFFAVFLLLLFVLSFQRNWIEADKYRIIICGFLSLYVFLGFGIRQLLFIKKNMNTVLLSIISFALPVMFVRFASLPDFGQDAGFYKRKALYQQESPEYHALTKNTLLRISPLPNYRRLCQKLDFKLKGFEEEAALRNVFAADPESENSKFSLFYSDWKRGLNLSKKPARARLQNDIGEYVYIKLDLNKLAGDFSDCAEEIPPLDIVSLDLGKERLSDVFYAEVIVPWQKNPVPVCIMLNNGYLDDLKELQIDLNAFISVGNFDIYQDIVNSINYSLNNTLRKEGKGTGMISFPLLQERGILTFRIPKDVRIVIKNWFINGENGVPFKLDSWLAQRKITGRYRTEFFYNEPESYL